MARGDWEDWTWDETLFAGAARYYVAGRLPYAEGLADRARVGNARWVQMRAEELPGTLGQFGVVSFAASFHWMERPTVARIVRSMLDRNGVAIQIDAPSYRPDALAEAAITSEADALPHPFPPDDAIVELRRTYLGPDTRAGQGIRNSSPPERMRCSSLRGSLQRSSSSSPTVVCSHARSTNSLR